MIFVLTLSEPEDARGDQSSLAERPLCSALLSERMTDERLSQRKLRASADTDSKNIQEEWHSLPATNYCRAHWGLL